MGKVGLKMVTVTRAPGDRGDLLGILFETQYEPGTCRGFIPAPVRWLCGVSFDDDSDPKTVAASLRALAEHVDSVAFAACPEHHYDSGPRQRDGARRFNEACRHCGHTRLAEPL